MIVKLKDVVNRVNNNIDRFTTDIQYYLGKGHGECGELAISEHGDLKKDVGTLGFKFHFGFKPGDTLFFSRSFALRKAGMATYEGICSDSTYILRSKDEAKLLSKYLPIVLQSDVFWEYCDTHHTGGVNFLINWSTLADYEFDLPCLEEQQRISDRIWSAYNLKESYKKLLIATDELVKSQFIEMFGTLGNPKGKIESLGTLCNIQRGGSPRPISEYITDQSDGLNWIKIGDTDDSMYITKTEEKIKPSGLRKTRQVYAGDLLLSNSMSFGRPYILKIDGCIHDGWLVLHINDATKLSPIYLCSYLSQQGTYSEMAKLAAGGVVQNLNSNIIKQLAVIVPNIEEQTKYIQILEQADKSKFELRKSIEAIDAVIKSLING